MYNKLTILILALMLYGCLENKSREIVIIDESFNQEAIITKNTSTDIKTDTSTDTNKKNNKVSVNNKKQTIDEPSANSSWHNPVKASVLKKYSPENGHFGITFATKPQQEVKSVRDGIVIYSNNENINDNIIIIKHSFGFYSYYHNNQAIYVNKKDKIKKGQLISLTGKNNLYFEIKKYSTTVDPLKYIQINDKF